MAWDVNGEQVLEKTGKPLEHWRAVLDAFGGRSKAPRNMVGHLERTHRLPRFWAETLTSWYTGGASRERALAAHVESPRRRT